MPAEKSYALDNGEEIVCLEVVRSLPGKRLVFLGEYAGAQVFVKLFLDTKRGRRHWQRELDGLNAFKLGDIPTADLLYAGQTADQGWPVIVLAKLTGVKSVSQVWNDADSKSREQILRRMTALLARHHQAGLWQTDLHLDNFLLCDQEIFSLDGAGVRLQDGAVDQTVGLQNLGLFVAQLTPEWETSVPDIYQIYAAERGWQNGPGSELLLRMVRQARAGRWKEYRNKLFRSCTAFVYEKRGNGLQVVAREYAGQQMDDLLNKPDASFPGAGQALKNGNTCTVWATKVNGHSLVIKRYNVKGFWHGLKLSLRTGRGELSWVNGHRLLFYGISTPRPIALLKTRNGFLRPTAYLVTEYMESYCAGEWFHDPTVAGEEKQLMADQIARMLQGLQQQAISHGDMKASNILISDGKAMLIDLDAMQQHSNVSRFNRAWARDIRRFLQNWDGDRELLELFTNSLKSKGIDPARPGF